VLQLHPAVVPPQRNASAQPVAPFVEPLAFFPAVKSTSTRSVILDRRAPSTSFRNLPGRIGESGAHQHKVSLLDVSRGTKISLSLLDFLTKVQHNQSVVEF